MIKMTENPNPSCSGSKGQKQFLVLIEVKSAATTVSLTVSERDLEGITVDRNSNAVGYLAVLKDNDAFDCGFRFIERNRVLLTGTLMMSDLPSTTTNKSLIHIGKRWEDWILRPGAVETVYADEHAEIMINITHYLRTQRDERVLRPVPNHPNRFSDIHNRLKHLRKSVLNDAKKEGFLHQSILYHIISTDPELACTFHFQNRVGIPDIIARINQLE